MEDIGRDVDIRTVLSGHAVTAGCALRTLPGLPKLGGTKVEIVGICVVLPSFGETWETMAGMLEAIPGCLEACQAFPGGVPGGSRSGFGDLEVGVGLDYGGVNSCRSIVSLSSGRVGSRSVRVDSWSGQVCSRSVRVESSDGFRSHMLAWGERESFVGLSHVDSGLYIYLVRVIHGWW